VAAPNEKITRPLIDHIINELRVSDISRTRNYVRDLIKRETSSDDSSASFGVNLHHVPRDVYDSFTEREGNTDDKTTRWKTIRVGSTELTLFVHNGD
jgi:hypothetical protein